LAGLLVPAARAHEQAPLGTPASAERYAMPGAPHAPFAEGDPPVTPDAADDAAGDAADDAAGDAPDDAGRGPGPGGRRAGE
jgi:hypothetical protein